MAGNTEILCANDRKRRKNDIQENRPSDALGVGGMNRREIEETIRNYHWMVKEIERLVELLGDAGERLVLDYSHMGLPKPKGLQSDPVAFEAMRREKDFRKLKRYMERVKYIEDRIEWIRDEKERTVLDCLLDGMTIVSIANHLGCTRKTVREIRERIINRLVEKEKAPA